MNICELQSKLAESKMDNDCKSVFNQLASFIDWYAVNKDQNNHFMNILLQLVNKMGELSNKPL